MKRNLIVIIIASALYAFAMNTRVKGVSSSALERGFTRRFGAHSYLLQEPEYFRQYGYNKNLCCKNRQEKCRKKRCVKQIKKQHKKKTKKEGQRRFCEWS